MTSRAADVQDLYAEKVNPANPHQVERAGRWVDTTRHRRSDCREEAREAVSLRSRVHAARRRSSPPIGRGIWRSPCAGPDLSRARPRIWARWRSIAPRPSKSFAGRSPVGSCRLPPLCTPRRDGRIGTQAAGLVPVRRAWNGALPVPGWTGAYEWQGLSSAERHANAARARAATSSSANDSVARTRRIDAVLSSPRSFGVGDFRATAARHAGVECRAARSAPGAAAKRSRRMSTTLALGCWRGIAGLPLIPRRRRSTCCGSALCSAGSRRPGSTRRSSTISSFARRPCSFRSSRSRRACGLTATRLERATP